MLKNYYIFPALFTYDADGITVEFPNLPGAITAGDTACVTFSLKKIKIYG